MANPYSKSDYNDKQWAKSCAFKVPNCKGTAKECYKLPIRSPDGKISPAAVKSAIRMVSHISGITPAQVSRIKAKLEKLV
jgi:hypothetical protein